MNSLEDINFHIHGFQFQNSKDLMDLNEAMQKLRTWNEKDPLEKPSKKNCVFYDIVIIRETTYPHSLIMT